MSFDNVPEFMLNFFNYKRTIQGCSEKTVREYYYDLSGFFRYYLVFIKGVDKETASLKMLTIENVKSVTSSNIYSYLAYLADTKHDNGSTRARKICAIRSFYKYLRVKVSLIEKDPAKDIETPKHRKPLPKFLTETESVGLLDAIGESEEAGDKNSVRNYAIITLFLNCGFRVSELCGISLSDITTDLTQVTVIGKGDKERTVYLNGACRDALSKYLDFRASIPDIRDKNALFISRNKRRISVKTVQWFVYKYINAAGLSGKGYSVHKLRHTAATLMYNTGKVDIRTIKDILGHEQLNTTQIYTHVSSLQIKNALEENPLSHIKTEQKK
ncbi:MAG: tyrosine recombinase XerC [Oscillospiraceae bacterium]|nr:tyrosine recombinase XerC [Oscillospiraceae bacterium]